MSRATMRTVLLSVLALVLVVSAGAGESLSYFTTYVTAEGGYTIELHDVDTHIEETFDGGTKHINIRNIGEGDCYVRARIFSGDFVELAISGEGWSDGGDGYWYYAGIVHPGEAAAQLDARVTPGTEVKQDYNVIVVAECTPVQFDVDGQPFADWTLAVKGD